MTTDKAKLEALWTWAVEERGFRPHVYLEATGYAELRGEAEYAELRGEAEPDVTDEDGETPP